MPATHLESAILGMGGGAPVPATTLMRNEALLKAGALQSAIFNSANFALIATDEKGIIQLFNIGAERMLGYAAAEVVDKISPAHISDAQEVIARAVVLSREFATAIAPGFEALVFKAARAIEDNYELTYLRKNGTRLPVILSVTALRDAAEKIIGYLLIGTDNSARMDVEDRLRWTEESFHLMVESVTDYAIVMLDPQGRIMSWNSGAQRIKGYSAEEIVGQSFTRFYSSKDAERGAPTRDLEAARTRGRFEDEGWRMRRDGSTFWANIVLTAVLDHVGNLRGFAQLTRDLTGRRQAEDEIAKAKAVAEKTSLASAEFLSGMSHELRTSLNAILGFAQLMESEQPPPTPSQKESVAKIVQAGWYLMELINEVMDLAMIESGRLSWSLEPMSLADVMHECQAAIEPQAQKSGIRMTLPEIDGQCFIKADRTRVKQVLTNLLSNAIKYNRPGGSVVVECTVSAPQRVRISVTDTGAGMQPDQLAQLFRPFSRVGQETSAAAGRRHRSRRHQAARRADGRRNRRAQPRRQGQRVLDRAGNGRRAAADCRRRGPHPSNRAGHPPGGCAAHIALCRGQSGQSAAGRTDYCAAAGHASLERAQRSARDRAGALGAAGRHPDGHQSAGHERHQSDADAARRNGHRAYSRGRTQRQCDTARYRTRPRGRVFPLSDQADQSR
jgi:PAS domain S-box-containing protein